MYGSLHRSWRLSSFIDNKNQLNRSILELTFYRRVQIINRVHIHFGWFHEKFFSLYVHNLQNTFCQTASPSLNYLWIYTMHIEYLLCWGNCRLFEMLPPLALYWADHSIRFACSPLYLNVWQSDPFSTNVFFIHSNVYAESHMLAFSNEGQCDFFFGNFNCFPGFGWIVFCLPIQSTFHQSTISHIHHMAIFSTISIQHHRNSQHRDWYCNKMMRKLVSNLLWTGEF